MKLKNLGRHIMFNTEIAYEDYDLVKRMKPEALTIKNDKGNIIFMFTESEYSGVSDKGVTFDRPENWDKDADITIEANLCNPVENATDLAMEFGAAIKCMNIIKDQVSAAMVTVINDLTEAEDAITIL